MPALASAPTSSVRLADCWRLPVVVRESVWTPQEGPQEKFAASDAYELLYGGAAGGGKTWALAHDGLDYATQGGRALFLRRTFPELQEVMDLLLPTIQRLGGVWKEQKKRAEFPNGGVFQFGYCSTYREVLQYQGQQFGWIGFDEIGLIAEERVWTYLMSRNRSGANRLPKKMRASANPGGVGHHWLKRRFITSCDPSGTPYVYTLPDGSVATRSFIQSFLKDNHKLVENDPGYAHRLEQLSDVERRWLKDGDWNAGAGMGLAELAKERHFIQPFEVMPPHWTLFGALDWGYAHPFCFGLFAADEAGSVYLIETVHGRRLQPPEIVQRIDDTLQGMGIPLTRVRHTIAGHDCWADVKARAEHIPTIAEHATALGLPLVRANISRIAGVQNVRRYLTWKAPDGAIHTPRFRLCDTPSNRRVFECLETRVADPDNPEDILKTDADDNGEGGDDPYDMVRYGLASRPIAARVPKQPEVKHPHQAHPLLVKDGKLVKRDRPPQTAAELAEWAENRMARTRLPSQQRSASWGRR